MFRYRLPRRIASRIAALAAGALISLTGSGAQQPRRDLAFGMGLIPPKQGDFAKYPTIRLIGTASRSRDAPPVPEKFDLEKYLPPIGNQGSTGSCVGWSTAYYCYSISVARQRKLSDEERTQSKFLFAPGYIWNQFNGGDAQRGMQIFEAFKVLETMGCATLDVFPWEERAIPFAPTDSAKQKAEFYKAPKTLVLYRGQKFGEPADPDKMRKWLADTKTPIVTAIPVYSDFPRTQVAPDFVYEKGSSDSQLLGYHAVCIIGYDKSKHAFEMVNSWGEKWGDHGKLWLAESFLRDYAFQGCVQTPGGPRMRGLQIVPSATNPKVQDDIKSLINR